LRAIEFRISGEIVVFFTAVVICEFEAKGDYSQEGGCLGLMAQVTITSCDQQPKIAFQRDYYR
jgi:hypothetical protein